MNLSDSVTISIAAYNDAKALKRLLDQLIKEGFSGEKIHYFLIDDGSQDDTAGVIKTYCQNHPNTTSLIHTQNRGFGETIREAVQTPQTDYILYLSGDNQFRADAVYKLIHAAFESKADYVIGRRGQRQDNGYRRLLSQVYNRLISWLCSEKVNDINSIFIVKREAIQTLPLKSKSAFIHAEIFLRLRKSGFQCGEVEIVHFPRLYGKGQGGKLRIILPTLIDLLRYVFIRERK